MSDTAAMPGANAVTTVCANMRDVFMEHRKAILSTMHMGLLFLDFFSSLRLPRQVVYTTTKHRSGAGSKKHC